MGMKATAKGTPPKPRIGGPDRARINPRIERLWQGRLPQIDRQIRDFYRGSDASGGLTQLLYGVTDWLATQEMDSATRAEFNRLAQSPRFLREHLDERVRFLRSSGKIGYAFSFPPLVHKLQRRMLPAACMGYSHSGRTATVAVPPVTEPEPRWRDATEGAYAAASGAGYARVDFY